MGAGLASIISCMEPKPVAVNISESSLIGAEFLISDARIALTLLDLSETAQNAEIRARRVAEAYKAYKTILSLMGRIDPSVKQIGILKNEIKTLAERLKAAGMDVD